MSRPSRRIAILGSTGSIGQQALEVARALPGELHVIGLAAGHQIERLAAQVAEFRPRYVSCAALVSSDRFAPARVLPPEELVAQDDVDLVLVATVGGAGIRPTLAALGAGKLVALANKEVLVVAGAVVTRVAEEHGGVLLPVDSEHSAIWQCLVGEDRPDRWTKRSCPLALWERARVRGIVLTASGGAFRDRDPAALDDVTPAEALKHPNWQMGPKVTVDCATLMNKGFEVIEAHWLFGLPDDRIDVVMHRESVVHSLVEFVDGSVKAQLGPPDMRLPIQYALTYPQRRPAAWPRLDLVHHGRLTFQALDEGRYPCFQLAREAARQGGTFPGVLSGADEAAVERFIRGEIRFTDIPRLVEGALAAHRGIAVPTLDELLAAEREGRDRCSAGQPRSSAASASRSR
ncbi:MAG: 1-deoxy-D-xylulose-5-phosphate reductoisomerase [Chloroflexi bacterium]|nr:1-deoxy-D-xylulose-5-phosphate reductoisomerase [Chloroflexota bacterium]